MGAEQSYTISTSDQKIIDSFKNIKPSYFGSVSKMHLKNSAQINQTDVEVEKSTKKFFYEYSHSQTDPSAVKGKFPLIIDKTKFLGEPLIGKITRFGDSENAYFVVALHFNIPPLNPALGPIKYSFARFATKFVLFQPEDRKHSSSDSKSLPASVLLPVKVVAVYPVNETLGIARSDTSTLTLEANPQYAGTSVGSANQAWSKQEAYNLNLPTVISSATRYGDAAWIYYPARAQPLILGSKTTIAVLAIPKKAIETNFQLRLQCTLDYQLKYLKYISGFERRLLASGECSLDCMTVDELLKIHSVDLPDQIKAVISNSLIEPAKSAKLTVIQAQGNGQNDYILDKETGKMYVIRDSKLVEIAP
ncbi:MAG: hypothetical protein P4L53_06755 [Candidatus Obscuribacterales bacterium]|nr:hypothetical protein [Candidatus Obscuribacterales bacterium]